MFSFDKSSRNKSRYICTHCGHTDHTDVHAAKNIRDKYAGCCNRTGIPSIGEAITIVQPCS
ncbi:MAG: transposase [Treponema sp.]|nr:transposase [Treponema sp.]